MTRDADETRRSRLKQWMARREPGSRRSEKAALVTAVCLVIGSATSPSLIEAAGSSGVTANELARRMQFEPTPLVGPIDDVMVVGDSIYFDAVNATPPPLSIVPTLQRELDAKLGARNITVTNRSRPGLAVKFADPNSPHSFIALAAWLPDVLQERPDLVILPTSTIDINLFPERPANDLAEEIVRELSRIVNEIRSLGIEVLVVPAFGINDSMFDVLKSLGAGRQINSNANARVEILNAALRRSNLPLLFPGFGGMDRDRDGMVDASLFVDYAPGRFPDDGVHTNLVGDQVIANTIVKPLIRLIEATPAS